MTKAFERFLRSFSDDDLAAFATEQVEPRPAYRRAIEVAIRIELDRRDLWLDIDSDSHGPHPQRSPAGCPDPVSEDRRR